MRKPDGWDSAPAYTGDNISLPAGGYICKIKDAKEVTSQSGKQMLVLLLDIHDGMYAGYFQRQFSRAKDRNPDAKWQCVYRQLTEGENSLPHFKGMITCIEESNAGYKWNFDESTLKGKLIGGVFGREQYLGSDNKHHWSTKCQRIRSVEAIKNGVDAPEDKPLYTGSAAPPPPYNQTQYPVESNDFTEIDDDGDLPF